MTLEVRKSFVLNDVRSLEEAEGLALELVDEQFGDDIAEVVTIDSFEGGEGMPN